MIGASKILTVSYGTFSCTLEGFDDSFSTMKAIAEYFRDLASDDRYFGAEPPTPDAEMLAKIAGRQIKRQVEAKVEDNGVTLRPLIEADVAAPVEAPVEAPAVAQPAVAPIAREPIAAPQAPVEATVTVPSFEYDDDQDEAQAVLAPAAVTRPIDDADTESVAAKLRRIRAVVAQNQAAGTAAPIFTESAPADDLLPEQETVDIAEDAAAAEAAAKVIAEQEAKAKADADAKAEAEQEAKAKADADAKAEAEQEAKAKADADAKAEAEQEAKAKADADAKAEAEQEAKAKADADAKAEAEQEAKAKADADAKAEAEQEAKAKADADAKAEAEQEAKAKADADAKAEAEQEAKAKADADAKAEAEPEADDDAEDEADANAELEADALSNILNLVAKDTDEPATNEADPKVEDAVEEQAEAAQDDAAKQSVKPSRARIIKVKKADLKKAAEDAAEESSEETTAEAGVAEIIAQQIIEPTADPLGKTNLSPEDEAELLAELADVELDTPAATPIIMPAETDDGINAAMRIERTSRALNDAGGAQDEASVSRLLNETNAKLDTDESTRRRSAISHLRAAVAATVADRKFTKTDKAETPDQVDAYRTDLADVIRPHRPTAKGGTRVNTPAPLILVSEQRIDQEADAPAADASPIRPRRIQKGDVTLHEVETISPLGLADLDISDENTGDDATDSGANIFADSTSFADFADKMSATELPDLLEAAAAYTAYVEGRPHFARPQIMRQVAGFAGKDEFNREEGLRSFGQLLRQGKIIKIKRGQFEIAKTTRFNPEARFAGE